ncbi:PilZ domain-containing protein [Paenibacillus cremeus]|uniref:PilZ domain-containing protein n=2 Tax=Paenibacillus cremeus TaxID=2163881 RepID=A0A559KB77_9BACL|nr:PilZ domain-containing protein [Paenibacillus cremeus]
MRKEKYRSPSGILMQSRTVVEKKDFVSTGVLTYAEGDILEIEIAEYKAFKLGESVKLTVYSPGGIYPFESTVVAIDHGALMVINPPQNRNLFAEKRESPRVNVSQSGKITSITKPFRIKQPLESQVELLVQNISVIGVGFKVLDMIDIPKLAKVDVSLDLGFELACSVEIVRTEPLEVGCFYGAKYIDLPADKMNPLRAFVLKHQVMNHYSVKREEEEKRLTEK